ncbi:tRNA pseudouridine(55) synthase TruB [Rhodocyclus tenuis]|uniref:tRNA pseudouridine synthase B n=2 Tax=Rhodocyclus TaxID=1064 RepID=A0A6L5JY17_RHOTE|nr:tRNA pseudouridine(55) synthase TruB [Rhodocyclus gracilis]MQY51078.1 tRNA pseudouridine(55) synthase TruB [Rhodocyclus gracilis]NJA88788.1 tRNA pseudouridine(55) synthase TruB [Rhodocyclus gracilis]
MSDGRRWQRVDGVLLLDKPAGMTSNTALQKARRLFQAARAGHTGTLDPMATGLLPLCFGEATKFSADLLEADKTYETTLHFGERTDTGDAEGEVIETRPVSFSLADLEAVLARFRGAQEQIPPMYSALKRNGRPLYELARQGVTVERAPRAIVVHALELLAFGGASCRLRATVSKGTYIRTLGEDIGEALGCGAHLTALRRVGIGPLQVSDALSLEQLEAVAADEREALLAPTDALLHSLPMVTLASPEAERFAHGGVVRAGALPGRCRVYGLGRLLGLGEGLDDGTVKPRRLVCE